MPTGVYKRKPVTIETRRRISESKKGKKNPMYGVSPSKEHRENISKGNKGKKISQEDRAKKSKSVGGKNHYNWKGGVSPIIRRIRVCYKYKAWRNDVFARDNFMCNDCNKKDNIELHVHHQPQSLPDLMDENKIDSMEKAMNCDKLWDINIGVTLCKKCHHKRHRKK